MQFDAQDRAPGFEQGPHALQDPKFRSFDVDFHELRRRPSIAEHQRIAGAACDAASRKPKVMRGRIERSRSVEPPHRTAPAVHVAVKKKAIRTVAIGQREGPRGHAERERRVHTQMPA